MTISLFDRFGDFIMSATEGRELGLEIAASLAAGDDVTLDFGRVRSVISAFLNPAVGELYGTFASEEIDRRVRAINADEAQLESFEIVRENARHYYNDPAFREARDASLDRLFVK